MLLCLRGRLVMVVGGCLLDQLTQHQDLASRCCAGGTTASLRVEQSSVFKPKSPSAPSWPSVGLLHLWLRLESGSGGLQGLRLAGSSWRVGVVGRRCGALVKKLEWLRRCCSGRVGAVGVECSRWTIRTEWLR